MRKYPNILVDIIAKSGVNLNSISKMSGVSNTYLTKLSKGGINHPGKDKIASILLGLNYTITDINKVLAEYDYQQLNEHDIPQILINNRRRKIEGRMMPHYDRLYFELMLTVFEYIGGTKVLLKDRPSGIYQPYELYMMKEFQHEVDDDASKFLKTLTGKVVEERLENFWKNCEKGDKVITYMCRDCLDDSLVRALKHYVVNGNERTTRLLAGYYANALSSALKFPEQHKLLVVDRCPKFRFLIQNADSDHPKINFTGENPHASKNPYDQSGLEGFSTDSKSMILLFENEIRLCEESTDMNDPMNTPEGFRDYVRSRFAEFGAGDILDSCMDELMSDPGVKLL